jgi:hypothetical protein
MCYSTLDNRSFFYVAGGKYFIQLIFTGANGKKKGCSFSNSLFKV